MASHEHGPIYEGPKTLEESLKERFVSVGDEFKELATSQKQIGNNFRELYASVPDIYRAENDDQISLGFVVGYKTSFVEGEPRETTTLIRAYRYDSSGPINNADTRDNYISTNELDKALQQESWRPDKLDDMLTAIELDIQQLKTFQKMNPPIRPIKSV